MVTSALSTYEYTLTTDDRVASVTPRFLAFAQENGAPELTTDAVVGRSVFDFVSGTTTQQLYSAIYSRVRSDNVVVVLPFRCDSATVRREMIMRIGKQPDDLLAVQCTLISAEPRQSLRALDREVGRNDKQLTICSLCLNVLVEPVGWMDIEDAVLSLHLLEKETAPQLMYAVCPKCAKIELG